MGREIAQHVKHLDTRMGGETSTELNWHNYLWSYSVNLTLATGMPFYFCSWKINHLYIFFLPFFFFSFLFFFPWEIISSIWCQQEEVLKQSSFINLWPMYWKMDRASVAAITAIHCGHLAWGLNNFWHRASEEIAFSISFWHFSSWQRAAECCLNPKSNAMKAEQL